MIDAHAKASSALLEAGKALKRLVPRRVDFDCSASYVRAYRQHVSDFETIWRMASHHRKQARAIARSRAA